MPLGFNVGPLFIRYYGIILMLGAVAAAFLAEREAKRRKQDPELVWDGLIWVIIFGIIGARLWHIFTPTPSDIAIGLTTKYYLTHPLVALSIWRGGLGIPGAVIAGALALYIFSRRRKVSFMMWADIVAPAVALGQAIGRWGNFVNQEIYGKPTDLPWAINIDPQYRLPEFMSFSTYHPLFLYESIWNLLNMALLLWLGRKHSDKLVDGDLFLIYLIGYPLGRFLLEFLRLNSAEIGGINANQSFMLIVMLAAGIAIFLRHRKKA